MWESVEKKMVMWAASSADSLDEYQEEVYRVLAISNVVRYICWLSNPVGWLRGDVCS